MPAPRLIPALALIAAFGAALPAAAQPLTAQRQPLYGKTDSLGDPGRIGPNGALHKKVVAGDYFTFRDLIEMDLRPDQVITLTMFTTLPQSAPRPDRDSPFPQR